MNSILQEIVASKRGRVGRPQTPHMPRKKKVLNPVTFLMEKPFIAEVKRSSPSAGDIRGNVDPAAQADLYRRGGAGAVSVLTEETYFKGSMEDLESVAARVDLPLLCKDFIVHESQVEAAFAAGADMVLLIAAILEEEELRRLSRAAIGLGMTVLHEIHGFDEFRKLRKIECTMVGVNARDLTTFTIDTNRAAATMEKLEGSFLKVAESGIGTADDVRMMRRAGADAFLVGTALMKAGDPAAALNGLYRGLI